MGSDADLIDAFQRAENLPQALPVLGTLGARAQKRAGAPSVTPAEVS